MTQSQDELDPTRADLRRLVGRLERRLAEAEAKHRALAESLDGAILYLGEKGQMTCVSGDPTGILDCTIEEIVGFAGRRPRQVFEADEGPTVLDWLRRVAKGTASSRLRLIVRDKAGNRRWLDAALTPVRDASQQLTGTECVVRDVSEQAQYERIVSSLNSAAEVVQRQALGPRGVFQVVTQQLAAHGFVSAIALLDESGQYLSFAQVSGQERALRAVEELTGLRTDQARIPLDSIPAYADAIRKGEPVHFAVDESFLARMLPEELKKVAETALCLLPPLKMVVAPMIVDDKVVGLLAVYGATLSESCAPAMAAFANQTAIAMRNSQLVARIRESEEQYRSIFEGATDGFLLLDGQETIVEANAAACAMHGYRPEEIVGLPLRGLVHPSRHRRVSDLGREVESRGGFEAESVHVRKDGTSFPVEVRGTLLSYRGQLHTLVSVLDIAERVRAQQALLRAEKLRALAQMAGSIAHEFNNILVSIRGYADLALIGVPQDLAKVREDLQWIQSGVKDAAHAVRRLQHLYRRADDLSDLVPVQVDDLASEALAMTQLLWQDRLTAQGQNLAVNTRFAAPPLVLGNPDELRRILARVIANAIDAMPTGGTLTVASGCDAAWSFVTVSDTGAGVVSDLPEKVFEPFFTTEMDADDGLGMTMSMNILERHGGELSVDSKPGEGTTFTLRLPALSGPTSDDNR